MNKDEYKKLVDEYTPKENKVKNAIIAFLVGGLVGFVGQVIVTIFMTSFGMEQVEACSWLCILVILFASFLTALGFFDNWVTRAKAGLIVPTTGFAHSITSAALDYKKEGLITGLGANFFKLAGSVLLYGMIASFFLAIFGVIVYG
ncbi:MAG: SpoVA/SpoVAEb family sporulation membrane protein [Bacilli bacterium]|jgi:stage V sporulation protein AC|nr:SpoVA/SpoVAEb family sporulation membrane protein [Bacilli bacterium]